MKILEFWTDDKGMLSQVRLLSTVAMVIACILSLRIEATIELVLLWVIAAFAPKVIQKFGEKLADKKLN